MKIPVFFVSVPFVIPIKWELHTENSARRAPRAPYRASAVSPVMAGTSTAAPGGFSTDVTGVVGII